MGDDVGAYLSAVEGRFVALRGRGYMLSALDVARLESWRDRGVPLSVALRVIEQGVRDYRRTWRVSGGPRGLGYFEAGVDEAMRARAERLVGAVGADEGHDAETARTRRLFERLLDELAGAGRAQPDGPVRHALRRAWQRVRAGASAGQDVWALTAEVDLEIVEAVAATLPPATLEVLEREARREAAESGGARMGREARDELERFALEAKIRSQASVPELLEVLLDPAM